MDFETKKRDLKIDHYEKLSKYFNNLFWLDVGGGEPFLKKIYIKLSIYLKNRLLQFLQMVFD